MTYRIELPRGGVFEAWRSAARCALSHSLPPEALDWYTDRQAPSLLPAAALPHELGAQRSAAVPSAFLDLAQDVLWHKDEERFSLLYQALWRLARGDRKTLSPADPLGRRLGLLRKSVSRDLHKFHAFLRFHEMQANGPRRKFGAWFEPEHYTLEPATRFFAKRFGDMDWIISTPDLSAEFTNGKILFHPAPEHAPQFSHEDAAELWQTYFANIFNPARVKTKAMLSEMPKKYWKNLPETQLIPSMLRDAEDRVARMIEAGASRPNPAAEKISTRFRAELARKRES